ncbi:hypothetical protein ACH34W_40355 [Actinomadura sp. 6N118]
MAEQITPYVVAAASAYGGAVLAQAQQETATAALGVGRRLARKIFGGDKTGRPIPEEWVDVIADYHNPRNAAALRGAIHKALAEDGELVAQAVEALAKSRNSRPQVATFGERSPAVGTNTGIIMTGDDAYFSSEACDGGRVRRSYQC